MGTSPSVETIAEWHDSEQKKTKKDVQGIFFKSIQLLAHCSNPEL